MVAFVAFEVLAAALHARLQSHEDHSEAARRSPLPSPFVYLPACVVVIKAADVANDVAL